MPDETWVGPPEPVPDGEARCPNLWEALHLLQVLLGAGGALGRRAITMVFSPKLEPISDDGSFGIRIAFMMDMTPERWVDWLEEYRTELRRLSTMSFTVADAADLLHLSAATVRRRCIDGALPAAKVGRAWVIPGRSIIDANEASTAT